jgi:hypothetical protein
MILPTGATVAVADGAPGRGRERQLGDGSTLSRSDTITIPRHVISPRLRVGQITMPGLGAQAP